MRILLISCTALTLLWSQTLPPRKIAMARVAGTDLTLFVAAADGSDEHPLLATSGNDYDAAWAPDGASIVFTSERDGSADLFRVKTDGTGLEQLTKDPAYDDQAAFSPDSRQVVFVSTRGQGLANLWTLNLATRAVKAVTSGAGGNYRPSWSPDGKWIAFASGRENPLPFSEGRWERLQLADIYLIHPDGSGLKKITVSGNFCGSPKWIDGGHVVSYCMTAQQTLGTRMGNPVEGHDTRLVSFDIATSAATDLAAGAGVKINPSPLAGGEIAYIKKGNPEPGIYYLKGTRGPRGSLRIASWSPDGKHVVFQKRVTGPPAPLKKAFSRNANYELNLSGPVPTFNAAGTKYVTYGRGGPDAKFAALLVNTLDGGHQDVVYQDKTRNVLPGPWSSGGDRIIFSLGKFAAFFDGFHSEFLKPGDRVEGGAQVAIVNTDGTGFQELTSGDANNGFPSFAPDGKRFVYRTFSAMGNGLRIMNLETKAVTSLTNGYDNFPLWSPRGDLIMFARLSGGAYVPGETYDIYTVKPDGSGLKRLTNGKGNDAHMGWSPDGEYIAFASSRMGFKDEGVYTDAPQPYGEIFVMKYDGTGVEQLTDNQWEEGTPAWQPSALSKMAAR